MNHALPKFEVSPIVIADDAPINTIRTPLKKNTSAVDWAHGALFRAIVSLRMSPGEKLSRKVLAKWLGVSLTPLRDALLRLEHQGLIETKAQSETRVALLDASELHAQQFERVAIETEIVRRLARRKHAPMQQARAAMASQETAIDTGAHIPKRNLAFHESLFAAAGMERVYERCLARYYQMERCFNIAPIDVETLKQGYTLQRQILDRIDAGDSNGASAAMRAYLSDDTASIGHAIRARPEYFT